ncbi:MAG TPA: 2-succinyl-6-hydroxy-2,4-cyclohexadiene-1-carboxylate synthase, partial [Vibrio sp.]|nr:2-succinyl-6-hydroxy-2,4-cyclohexadiene-1-carboxylate synthase [Vibrio sp.]
MNKFTVDNQSMAYLDEGQGPVVVLGHSYLWDSAMWKPQIDALKTQYRCIVPELWSHG